MSKYHSKYYANFLSLQQPNLGTERLWSTLLNATIDLNPHQVQWALFFFKNPLHKGVILADEVWLWKTIEAWLVLCQLRSEFKRNILLIVPASLRKQWKSELEEKFFLESVILDWKTYKEYKKKWNKNPFNQNAIVISSYEFATKNDLDLSKIKRDTIVLDEAHKLRNVYRDTNSTTRASKLHSVIKNYKKILLTATPLQNSLMELYGLVSYIDEYAFWNAESFRSQFSKPDRYKMEELKKRLTPLVNRTLRQQVREYIKFTNRISITQNFEPTDIETELYEKISEFLQREDLMSINSKTKHLITLILRKLLASSSRAIAWTLWTMIQRLESKQNLSEFTEESDLLDVYDENIDDTEEQEELVSQLQQLEKEIKELKSFHELATNIKTDTKASALLTALKKSFEKIGELWWNKKALIFTESRRTQDYLKLYLESNGYEWKVVLFNGSNGSPETKEIYKKWMKKHEWTSKISWSKESDIRASLVEHFKEEAEIMIATESASEWVNLQFCSLLINYDLPWNPQRIEQRIWRCHRYWQKSDVLVVNFLNTKNYADKRVYELLSEKFNLFDWVFGASDEILWALDDGTNFEQRILSVYQNCRSKEDIDSEFKKIEEEYKEVIEATRSDAKRKVIENFDAEVLKRLKDIQISWLDQMDIFQKHFWYLSKIVLEKYADFDDDNFNFTLKENPFNVPINKWKYTLKKSDIDNAYFYRLQSSLWQETINYAKNQTTEPGEIMFNYNATNPRVTGFRDYKGKAGWLQVDKLTISSFEQEEYLLVTALTEDWEVLHPELAKSIFHMPWEDKWKTYIDDAITSQLKKESDNLLQITYDQSIDRNSQSFQEEIMKLDAWEEDRKIWLLKAMDEIKEEIQTKRRESLKINDNNLKLQLRNDAMKLEVKQRKMQEDYFKQVKEIEDQKRQLIQEIEARMQAGKGVETLFIIKRSIV